MQIVKVLDAMLHSQNVLIVIQAFIQMLEFVLNAQKNLNAQLVIVLTVNVLHVRRDGELMQMELVLSIVKRMTIVRQMVVLTQIRPVLHVILRSVF